MRIQKETGDRLLDWEVNQPPERLRRTMVADAGDGRFWVNSLLFHWPAAETGRYYFDVAGAQNHWQLSLSADLFDDAALANGARILDADVYDNCAHCLRFAKSCGARSMRAHNDSQKAPMLAINRKLGYQLQVGDYRLVKRL